MTKNNNILDFTQPRWAKVAASSSRAVPRQETFYDDRTDFAKPTQSEQIVSLLPTDCHPKIRSLADYWLSICPGNRLPGRQHFDPIRIPPLLANIYLIDVHREPVRFRFRLLGSRIVAYAGEDNKGKWFDEKWPTYDDSVLLGIVQSGRPSWFRGPSNLRPEKDYYELERVRLPLARDGMTVDMILGLTIFFNSQGREIT